MNLMILGTAVETAIRMKVKPNWDKLMTTLAISEEYLLELNPKKRYEIIRQLLSHPNFDDTDVYNLTMFELENSSEKPIERVISSSCSGNTITIPRVPAMAETPILDYRSCFVTATEPVDAIAKPKTPVLEDVKKPISLRVLMRGSPVKERQGDDEKEKTRANKKTKKRARAVSEQEEEEPKGKKTKKNEPVLPDQPMPENFKQYIRGINGTDAVLVIQKELYQSDISKNNGRFSVPLSKVRNEFLKEDEKIFLETRVDTKVVGMDVKTVYERSNVLTEDTVQLKRWGVGTQATCVYNLVSHWNDIVKNNLCKHNIVQLWAFRVEEELRFALVKVNTGKLLEKRSL